ncbi:uncharacterized protein METZ01_LOCUS48844 [marine metagenome]|uniref:Uncharacterized protein n=1 Tax=marine metagenome TaxID=408172 RepID=A0A381RVV6_9ZZZZ
MGDYFSRVADVVQAVLVGQPNCIVLIYFDMFYFLSANTVFIFCSSGKGRKDVFYF